jgi:hypothetical protein
MLKLNRKVVSDEVTNEDIDPVLLLWDTKNQTWYVKRILYIITHQGNYVICNLCQFTLQVA